MGGAAFIGAHTIFPVVIVGIHFTVACAADGANCLFGAGCFASGMSGAGCPTEAAIALCIAGMATGPGIRGRIVGIRVGGQLGIIIAATTAEVAIKC